MLLAPFAFVFSASEPVTVYLTWQRSPETTMTIHWITNLENDSDFIEYQRKGEAQWQKSKGSHVKMPDNYPFWIHTAELTGLKPDTDYFFKTFTDGQKYKFRTMSDDPSKPIRFLAGGDVYHDGLDVLEKMNRQAAKMDPMFALVGGDIAYNYLKPSSMPKLMPRWMDWLIAWKNQMVTSDGKLIPMVAVIGNHDVKGGYDRSPKDAAFFYSLFAFPGIQGFNVLDFGSRMSIVVLDSGHTHPIEGYQTRWLGQTLEQRRTVPHKFGIYHVAAFPSVRKFNGKNKAKIRNNWVPLFEKFGVNAIFEHHDHAYKRTWPILNGKPDPKGVLYLGDGGWGVEKPRKPRKPADTWYLAKSASSRNVIFVTVHGHERHFIAINDDGQIIDEFISKNPDEPKQE